MNSNYTVSRGEEAEITGQPIEQPARTEPQSIRDFPHPGRLKVPLSRQCWSDQSVNILLCGDPTVSIMLLWLPAF